MNTFPPKEIAVDILEPGARKRNGVIPCYIEKNIEFDLEALASFSSHDKWEPVTYDALLIAAAVEFCDRYLVRSSMNWGRRFIVHVPVHDVERWSSNKVNRALVNALNLLTGDDWHFNFGPRKQAAQRQPQGQIVFPSDAEAVIAFSDGMDSRAVSELESKRLGKRLIRLRIGNKQHDISKKERQRIPFTAIPYSVKIDDPRSAERSARSRGFKFSIISAIAAYLIDAPIAIIPESGQGALAPVLLPVAHGYEDYRNHPVFTKLMECFIEALLDYRFQYTFPRLWMTKGETLREYVETCGTSADWVTTRSCWQQSRQVAVSGARRQCGICAACMLRRLSVHAAGLEEPPTNYVWESLDSPTWRTGAAKEFTSFTEALRQYAIAGVLHFEHLSSIRESSQYELIKRRRTSELARALAESPHAVAQNFDRLLQQHAREWSAFTSDMKSGSFVRKWIDGAS
ncbi:7-cyano-7-deazaguanine synthase [Pseudomonas sp. N3-W]|uniref:7-cyano-7-deazaguanine synthase n=1 Tax=Pseudomonas sp. N3-W TaxID=2975049 RepID=UPI00217F0ABB|nr:7-cyano-7-deazaguanine synthase [Pseudomonas sp. N3-W]UWF50138.1 7-cyano-7-deazaguanine synthase [Pseudomonas sp. N3-W]